MKDAPTPMTNRTMASLSTTTMALKRAEDAGHAGDDEAQHQRRSGLVVRGHAGEHEDAGADDRADAERRQRHRAEHALETMLALALSFLEQHVERLASENIVFHGARH